MRSRSLLWQLYPRYIIIAVMALAAIGLNAANSFKGTFLKQTESELYSIASIAGIEIAEKIGARDPVPIDAFCKKAGPVANVRLTVILPSGAVVGDSEEAPAGMENHATRPEIAEALKGGTGVATRMSQTLKKEMMYVAVPIRRDSKIVGIVRASMPIKTVSGITHPMFLKMILEGLLIAALVAIMTLVISRRIVKPLEEIRIGADKFRQGDFSHRLKVTGSDEVKELAKTMNQMAQDLKERLAKLKRLEDIQREFVANVSHELKTPIASIQGFAETLRDGADKDPEKSKPFLEIIASHAKRISTIIEDLLSLSHIEEGEKKIELEMHNLKEILSSSVSLCFARASEKDIAIELKCGDEDSAPVNATLFEQALSNLIDNAIKHSERNGHIVIECKPAGENFKISVKDFGCGIPPEHLGRIFERFYRVDKGRSREQGGTGLGLSIAKHIVELHHGVIRVESKPGEGSTFVIELPKA